MAILLLSFISCNTGVGDECTKDNDCDSGLVCDENFPDGYCLKPNCNPNDENSCTTEAQCTYFNDSEMYYCLLKCNENDDCREGYSCKSVPNNEYRVCLPD